MLTAKHNEEILKETKEKWLIIYRETPIWLSIDLSKTLKVRKGEVSKMIKHVVPDFGSPHKINNYQLFTDKKTSWKFLHPG